MPIEQIASAAKDIVLGVAAAVGAVVAVRGLSTWNRQLNDPEASEARKTAVQKRQAAARDIMYDELTEEGDEFTQDTVRAIAPIEEYLKPHLRR